MVKTNASQTFKIVGFTILATTYISYLSFTPRSTESSKLLPMYQNVQETGELTETIVGSSRAPRSRVNQKRSSPASSSTLFPPTVTPRPSVSSKPAAILKDQKKTKEYPKQSLLPSKNGYSFIRQKQDADGWVVEVPDEPVSPSVTIVTMFISLGTFQKTRTITRTESFYVWWMKAFSMLKNPVVAYFTNQSFADKFSLVRGNLTTKIHIIKEQDLWTFQQLSRVEKVNETMETRRFYTPKYICVQSAKYDLVKWVSEENPFSTRYMAYVDLGYFRDIPAFKIKPFQLKLPPGFSRRSLSFNHQNFYRPYQWKNVEAVPGLLTPETIFKRDLVRIGGGFFLATTTKMQEMSEEYRKYFDKYLKQGLIGTDQQILYAMFTEKERSKLTIQLYSQTDSEKKMQNLVDKECIICNPWFFLGYLCRDPSIPDYQIVNL